MQTGTVRVMKFLFGFGLSKIDASGPTDLRRDWGVARTGCKLCSLNSKVGSQTRFCSGILDAFGSLCVESFWRRCRRTLLGRFLCDLNIDLKLLIEYDVVVCNLDLHD